MSIDKEKHLSSTRRINLIVCSEYKKRYLERGKEFFYFHPSLSNLWSPLMSKSVVTIFIRRKC